MIQITKEQAEKIRKKRPDIAIKRTTNKYYVEDTATVRRVLAAPARKAVVHLC